MRQEAYMGEFLRNYKPPLVSLNATLNFFLAKPVKLYPKAIITQEVMFPDASFYQGEIDFDIMATKTRAIILRAGQNSWVDTQFERNYEEAKIRNLLVGVYWFYDGRASPGAQAALLVSLLRNKEIDMEIFIDWERNYGGGYEGLQNVVAMMQAVEAAGLNVTVGLYTGYYFFRANSNVIANANQYNYLKDKPLWLAWYTSNPANVLVPAPWTFITHWQFGTPIVRWGQQTLELDMNFYNGTQAEFDSEYEGANMQVIRGTALTTVNIRSAPSGSLLSPPRYLVTGDQVEADRNQYQWLHLTKINGQEVAGEQWASAGATQQYISWNWVTVEDPPPPPVEPTITHIIKVYSDGKISVDDGTPY